MPTPASRPPRTAASLDRRRFLQLTGLSAGAAAAASMLDDSIARAAAIPASRRHGSIEDVEHVVVLMQENRGFDEYFGSMRGVRGFGDPHPVELPSGKPVWHQSDGTREILPFRPDNPRLGEAFLEGLPHDWSTGHQALNAGHFDRWIPAKGTTTMAHLQRGDAAFHYALADAFTVCDAYHCSFLGNTDPNRYYLWTGWAGNDGKGGGPVLYNDEAGYSWTTYPERLEQAGVSWKVYQDEGAGLDGGHHWGWTEDAYVGNYGDTSLLYFDAYRNSTPGSPLYDKARTGTRAATGDDYFRILRADVAADRLPQVSYISAPEAFCEHPNWPTSYGAWYIAKVLDTLTSNPEVWAKTALFITYDENDGFFDHVVPPLPDSPVVPGASTVSTENEFYPGDPSRKGYEAGPYGLGIRVPMLVVSPWSTGGWVCSETFDHTSVIRFMEKRFGVHEPQITPWRRAVCGDMSSAFDFRKQPAKAPRLLDVDGWAPKDRSRHPDYKPTPPTAAAMPTQEPGVRPARPIGYDFDVVESGAGRPLSARIVNRGRLGVGLQARLLAPAGHPHSYTVGGGDSLDVNLPVTGAYRVDLHGPNGFYRGYAGDAEQRVIAVAVERDGRSGALRVVVTGAVRPCEVRIESAYTGALRDDQGRRTGRHAYRTSRARHVTRVDTGHSGGWYDLTVTVANTGFRRAFAGHIETGRASTSDPQLGR